MKNETLLNNLKNKNQFVPMVFDANECFFPQKTLINSWFFIGRCTSSGHELNFLFHLMSGTIRNIGIMNGVFSVTDKTTGFYQSKDIVKKAYNPAKVKNKELVVQLDFAELHGNLDKGLHLKAKLEQCSFDVKVHPIGDIIYNGGTGFFPLLQLKNNYQYSCPDMRMDGKIVIEGKEYTVKDGSCWYDRQFNSPSMKGFSSLTSLNPKWMWMGIQLDNGESISLWEILPDQGAHFCFATILHVDGTQSICQMKSAVENASELWHSKVTGQNYPTKWHVEISDFDIDLIVTCNPKQQEIVSALKQLNKYEAESDVIGTYRGTSVKGACCVELLGTWN